jgi:hypothetical protein
MTKSTARTKRSTEHGKGPTPVMDVGPSIPDHRILVQPLRGTTSKVSGPANTSPVSVSR